jgi:hypothetical protein
MLQVGLSECCICFTHTLQLFYLDVVYVCNGFQVFLGVFVSISEVCFKCFICLQTHVASVTFRCFKSRSNVVHGMRVRSRRRHGRRQGGVGPAWAHKT